MTAKHWSVKDGEQRFWTVVAGRIGRGGPDNPDLREPFLMTLRDSGPFDFRGLFVRARLAIDDFLVCIVKNSDHCD